jgi:hypothetical protein
MKKNQLIIIGAIGIVLVGILISYLISDSTLNKYYENVQFIEKRIDSIRVYSSNSNGIVTGVRYENIADYINNFKQQRPTLMQLYSDLKNGTGLAFWFPDKWKKTTNELGQYIKSQDELLIQFEKAMSLTQSLSIQLNDLVSKSAQQIENANTILNPNSDIQDFANQIKILFAIRNEIIILRNNTIEESKIVRSTDLSELLRVGVLTTNISTTNSQEAKIQNREKVLGDAGKLLSSYKNQVSRLLSNQSEITVKINILANNFLPIVNDANNRVEPVRNMISKLEEPLFNDNILGNTRSFLSGFTGGSSGGGQSISAMSLIYSVDPSTSQMIGIIKAVCDGISTANSELDNIINTTRPFISANNEFRSNRSRNNLQTLVSSTPQLSSFYESKRNIFEPITGKLDEAKNAINNLNSAASRIRIAGARNLVYGVTRGASQAISLVYRPFNAWQNTVTSTSECNTTLSAMEKEYVSSLDKYRSDQNIGTTFDSLTHSIEKVSKKNDLLFPSTPREIINNSIQKKGKPKILYTDKKAIIDHSNEELDHSSGLTQERSSNIQTIEQANQDQSSSLDILSGSWTGTFTINDPSVGHRADYSLKIDFDRLTARSSACGDEHNIGVVKIKSNSRIEISWPGCGFETVTFTISGTRMTALGSLCAYSGGRIIPSEWSLTKQ